MRWRDDQQQYGPWLYEPANCLRWDNNELTIPTADVKEGLHMLPWGHTAAAGATEKTRHRMIGSGWHIGTAMFLLFTLLAEPTEARRQDAETRETGWHRRGSSHMRRNRPTTTGAIQQSNCAPENQEHEPLRNWEGYCGIRRTPIGEHRSGSEQEFTPELQTALRLMGGEASPAHGDDGVLGRVGERLRSNSITADSRVASGASEDSL